MNNIRSMENRGHFTLVCQKGQDHLRPTPHGRQAGRTVGGHWTRRLDMYPTRGYSRRGNLTGHGTNMFASSRGQRLEPPIPPATGSPDPTKTLAFQPLRPLQSSGCCWEVSRTVRNGPDGPLPLQAVWVPACPAAGVAHPVGLPSLATARDNPAGSVATA
jgi:hypothetical protein